MKGALAFAVGLSVLAAAALRAEDASLTWDSAFPTGAAPERVHFRAHYFDERGGAHALEAWRESDQRLRRNTDGRIELYVEKSPSGENDYRLIDRDRGVLVRTDLASLYRMGVFPDWTGLAYVLNVPRGEYRVARIARQSSASSRGECTWHRLEVSGPTPSASEICWSAGWGLPVAIDVAGADGRSRPRFSLDEVGTFSPDARTFALDRTGLAALDADSDGELSD